MEDIKSNRLCYNFIRSYNAYEKKTKERLYQLIDFYSLFYFNFIKSRRRSDEHFWTNLIGDAKHRAWSGYAFEQVCMQHVAQIRQKLGISGVITYSAAWRSKNQRLSAKQKPEKLYTLQWLLLMV